MFFQMATTSLPRHYGMELLQMSEQSLFATGWQGHLDQLPWPTAFMEQPATIKSDLVV
jgi:hypothetical protein